MSASPKTVALVPLSELVELARMGEAMRKKQNVFFLARKRGTDTHEQLREALDLEYRFDQRCREVIARANTTPGLFDAKGGGS